MTNIKAPEDLTSREFRVAMRVIPRNDLGLDAQSQFKTDVIYCVVDRRNQMHSSIFNNRNEAYEALKKLIGENL